MERLKGLRHADVPFRVHGVREWYGNFLKEGFKGI